MIVSTGVTMYLSREANVAALREIATLAAGSTFATTFILPLELADPEIRPGLKMASEGGAASGTPFISFFKPNEMLALAREARFQDAEHIGCSRPRRSLPQAQVKR